MNIKTSMNLPYPFWFINILSSMNPESFLPWLVHDGYGLFAEAAAWRLLVPFYKQHHWRLVDQTLQPAQTRDVGVVNWWSEQTSSLLYTLV